MISLELNQNVPKELKSFIEMLSGHKKESTSHEVAKKEYESIVESISNMKSLFSDNPEAIKHWNQVHKSLEEAFHSYLLPKKEPMRLKHLIPLLVQLNPETIIMIEDSDGSSSEILTKETPDRWYDAETREEYLLFTNFKEK